MNQKWILSCVTIATRAAAIEFELCAANKITQGSRLVPRKENPLRVIKEADLPALLSHADDAERARNTRTPAGKRETNSLRARRSPTPQLSFQRSREELILHLAMIHPRAIQHIGWKRDAVLLTLGDVGCLTVRGEHCLLCSTAFLVWLRTLTGRNYYQKNQKTADG